MKKVLLLMTALALLALALAACEGRTTTTTTTATEPPAQNTVEPAATKQPGPTDAAGDLGDAAKDAGDARQCRGRRRRYPGGERAGRPVRAVIQQYNAPIGLKSDGGAIIQR